MDEQAKKPKQTNAIDESGDFAKPRKHLVATFNNRESAEQAKSELSANSAFASTTIVTLHGEQDAERVETSAQWFADTDVEMRKFKLTLANGGSLIAVPVDYEDGLADARRVCQKWDATRVSHFGEFVNRVLDA